MCSSTTALNAQYEVCEEIGRGRFGTIYRCYDTLTGEPYACKIIHKSLLTDETDRQCLLNEPRLMSLLSPHPNILTIHTAFDTEHSLSLILDLCHPLTLLDRITATQTATATATTATAIFPRAAEIMSQLLSAVAHCHRHGVAHRDIKPDNILFDEVGALKLADFGSAEWFGGGEGGCMMSGVVGTPYYVAPEVLMGREYDEKVDVWSCGVILYVLLSGVPPFYGETAAEIFEAVLRANLRFPTRLFRNVSPAAKDLLRKMICKDPSRRISAEQALRHPWILSGGESETADLT